MDENEKLMRVLLGALFALSTGIDLNYSNKETKDMILLVTDMVARHIQMELTDSQVMRLKEETAMFIVAEMTKEAV